jgi:hypothetical protein
MHVSLGSYPLEPLSLSLSSPSTVIHRKDQ